MQYSEANSAPPTSHGQAGKNTRNAQAFWSSYLSYYDLLNDSIPYTQMVSRAVELLAPTPTDLILDAGTGTGNVAAALLASGARVTGIDFSEEGLKMCRQKAPAGDFRFGDLTRPLEFPSGHFDKLACSLVLYTFEPNTQADIVQEFFRVLKPGGTLVITTLTNNFSGGKAYFATMREHYKVNNLVNTVLSAIRYSNTAVRIMYRAWRIKRRNQIGEYRFSSYEELTRLLAAAGFEVTHAEPSFAELGLMVHARKPLVVN